MSEAGDKIAALMVKHGISIAAEFVPFSKSRNAKEDRPSLNWRVTLNRTKESTGRLYNILTTDYMAGSGYCPASKFSIEQAGGHYSIHRDGMIRWECEHGYPVSPHGMYRATGAKPLMPDAVDVLSSLFSDSDVLDYGTFEEWAVSLGYDADSRKAEGIYRACLTIALTLRNAFGDGAFAELREACQDY